VQNVRPRFAGAKRLSLQESERLKHEPNEWLSDAWRSMQDAGGLKLTLNSLMLASEMNKTILKGGEMKLRKL
jgi:hypothetical protein